MSTASTHAVLPDQSVTIRPIRSTDGVMESELIRNPSADTRHFRFLGGVRELSQSELERLCNVDGTRSMALVATVQNDGREAEIGVTRYVESSNDHFREMGIAISDEWQLKGLGQLLVERLIEHARSCGVKRLYSVDFADNAAMRARAGALGMHVRRNPGDASRVIYSLKL